MSTTSVPTHPFKELKLAEHKLADMVTTIEFTMVSVIAGLMLFPWIDYATPLIRELRVEFWVYIAAMLALVLLLWTAFTTHAMTFVGWPIDIGHNLLYIISFPVVGIVMHFMSDPAAFFPLFGLIPLLGGLTALYDLHLIRKRSIGARGAAADLYSAVHSRQLVFVYMTLGGLLMTIVMAVLISTFPDQLVDNHLHVVFGCSLLGYVLFMLARELDGLNHMRDKILGRKAEEIATDRTGA